jgi:hypothetical protein
VNFTLSVDVFNNQGQRVLHSTLDNQSLTPQQRTALAMTIALPTSLEAGTYVVKTAALAPDGNTYAQSDSAGQFVATAASPTVATEPALGTGSDSDEPQPDSQ